MNEILVPARVLPSVEVVRLDVPDESTMKEINRRTLRPFAAEDVHVRRMFAVHDAVDSFWSRLPGAEVGQFAARAADGKGAPVIEGHRDEMAPIARVFRGERVKRDVVQRGMVEGVGDNLWAAVDFYWPRGRSDAEDLALDVDSGVRSEVSGRWRFKNPECSVCRADMRECEHMPGEMYEAKRAWYDMREVTMVREVSFVFRGGQLGTSLDLARSLSAEATPKEVVDAMLKAEGVRASEEDRDAMIEFARCYDTRKLAKKRRAERGWFGSLPRRTREGRISWFK